MKPATRRWELPSASVLPSFHPVLGAILASRGHDVAAARALFEEGTQHPDPFLLAGMPEAVIALGSAVAQGDRIAVYGDYDADGVTACALLTRALRAAGADVLPYIPNRMSEGYGLHAAALDELWSKDVRCVVTVDCGTSSVEVAAGRPKGMCLVITDHHLPLAPGDSPPALAPADALVNPKQPGCTYPFDALAGAGVAWKLVQALEAEGVVPPGCAEDALGLAALGTVADMMPLRGENRQLVRRGLDQLSSHPLPGLLALREVSGVRAPLRSSDLGFALAPRINAAGRMEDARLALRLCLSDDPAEATELAGLLDAQNRLRQGAVAQAMAEAEERVAALPDDLPAIVLGDPGWPMGIVGLVAGRLAERYARPTFIACLDPTEAKGSARSVRAVHMVRALDGAAHTLRRYGGHALAAGFSLDAERFEEFALAVSAAVAAQLGDAPRERVYRIDAAVGVGDIDEALCELLAGLEPCGQGHPEPLLALLDCRVLQASTFGPADQHLRVWLGPSHPNADGAVQAIAFNKPGVATHLPQGRRLDVCFGLEIDEWNGERRVRLRLRDLRPARSPAVLALREATPPPRMAPERRVPVAAAAG